MHLLVSLLNIYTFNFACIIVTHIIVKIDIYFFKKKKVSIFHFQFRQVEIRINVKKNMQN